MRIEDEIKKARKLVNNILVDYHEKIDVKKTLSIDCLSLREKKNLFARKRD